MGQIWPASQGLLTTFDLDEWGKIFEGYKLSKLTQKEMEHGNPLSTKNKISNRIVPQKNSRPQMASLIHSLKYWEK